jgi:hypothetical protein
MASLILKNEETEAAFNIESADGEELTDSSFVPQVIQDIYKTDYLPKSTICETFFDHIQCFKIHIASSRPAGLTPKTVLFVLHQSIITILGNLTVGT